MVPKGGNNDERLDALFRAYREACPDPDATANFMPVLWQRIEARQTYAFSFRRMAGAFVTAALALSVALGVYMAVPRTQPNSPQAYIEALSEEQPLDAPDIVGPVSLDLSDAASH
ncbi:MAG TPA: hypothetical protein VML19_10760 [Verrucomicrobiae bacterium]|nr:hypothetical protein [Verrucomicrobiae bacterium]